MGKIANPDKFFNSPCRFTVGATQIEQLPRTHLPEIAFIGRSNVGKSSLINALLNRKIAIASKTPGRTRQLNFFLLNDQLNIVDMPGYGYAKISKKEIKDWQKLSYQYLARRPNLKRLFLLIDARRGIGEGDLEMINIFNALAVSYQIIITKTDELPKEALPQIIEQIKEQGKKLAALHPVILACSSQEGRGITEIRKAITDLLL